MGEASTTLTGDLTIYTIENIRKEIAAGISGDMDILIDVKELKEIDITGMQLLLSLKTTAEKSGRQFKLVNIPQHIGDTLKMNGLDPGVLS